MGKKNYKFTIVIPIYNEEANIYNLYDKISEVCNIYDYKILFIDDGSIDKSLKIIKTLSSKNKKIEYISLSKNFGQQQALFAGICHAKGDFVITMDADLQHPPNVINKMIEKYEEGFEIVQTIKTGYENINIIQKIFKKTYYFIFNKISNITLPEHSSDFRLITSNAKNVISKFNEKQKFMRGIIQFIGFNYCEIKYDVGKREKGKPVSLLKLFRLGMAGIYSFSNFILMLPIYFSILFTFFNIFYFFLYINNLNTLFLIFSIFININFIFFGIIGVYLIKILEQIRDRPDYIIKEIKQID